MKVKYLLTALAVPALFAACSQEEIVSDVQNQTTELLSKVAGDVNFTLAPQSRLSWDADNNVAWETEDGFSLFWVGETAVGDLDGKVNALYKKDGDVFTSQNIVYEGNHVIVYPADYAHLSDKAIELNVGATQYDSIALGKRSIWTTDSMLTIKAPLTGTATAQPGVIYAGGYGEAVPASLQALSSNLVMNLHFAMGNATNVTIKKVVLKSNNDVFSVDGTLEAIAKETGKYNQDVKFVDGIPVNEVTLAMAKNTAVTTADTTYTVQFSLLPLIDQTELTNATYSIEVHTNYGIVTINEAKNVLARGASVYCNSANTAIDAEGGIPEANKALDLSAEIKLMAQHNVKDYLYRTIDATKKSNLTAYGKKIALDVKVNMKEASITGMEVANSEELIDAYETYTLLGKEGAENFVLTTSPFELTPEAVAAILANKKVTLEIVDDETTGGTIKLVGAHTAIPQFNGIVEGDKTYNLIANRVISATPGTPDTYTTKTYALVLGAEGTWNLDVDAAAAANTWAEIINDGTLTISESNPAKNAVALTANILNRDSVAFSGDVTLPVQYKQEEVAVTYVPATADVTWARKSTIQGLVNVSGILDVKDYKATIGAKGTVEVYGRFRNTDTGEIVNLGTIKIMSENATAIITENGNGTLNGSIELINRDDLVTVTGTNKGYIKWACDVATLKKEDTDVFNYIIVSENVTIDKDSKAIDHVEVDATARITTKKAAGETFQSLFVNEGNTLIIPTASIVKVASKFVLDGDVEVLGSFDYSAASKTGNGDVFYQN